MPKEKDLAKKVRLVKAEDAANVMGSASDAPVTFDLTQSHRDYLLERQAFLSELYATLEKEGVTRIGDVANKIALINKELGEL